MGSTEYQSRENALRVSARERIEHGRLPVVRPAQVVAGYGSGHICEVCDCPITARQAEYEVEDVCADRKLRFHAECHGAWQCECTRMMAIGNSRSGPAR